MDAEAVEAYLTSLQDQICGGLEAIHLQIYFFRALLLIFLFCF